MTARVLLLVALFTPSLVLARDNPENWLQVTSPHFIVFSNGSEKQARHVAGQFERMRVVFQAAFPGLQVDRGGPIRVLAVKGEKDFQKLEPEEYLGKGKLQLGGLFLPAPDKNYVLLRLDIGGDHPYAVVYHEYTHFLAGAAAAWMPLWLNEGLAEFYENTDIRDKDVVIGEPSDGNLYLLRQTPLLPLPTLFAVDHNSPYYHEENKGSIFYAESWALTHYLEIADFKNHTHRIRDYTALVSQNVDPVSAATRAFGDLKQLQAALENYVRQAAFGAFKFGGSTQVEEADFQQQPLPPTQADAVRADFLAYNRRTADAQALLQQVLKDDPNNLSAHETMGYLAFRQGNRAEARKWYAQAVALNSQDYLAHYYFAVLSMDATDSPEQAQVESSLRAAIRLNPAFAPAYDRLAVFYAMRQKNLDEAHLLEINAVQLDPGNLQYRFNTANVLLSLHQGKGAIAVLQTALKMAKNQQELSAVQARLEQAQQFEAMQEAMEEREQGRPGAAAQSDASPGRSSSVPGGAVPDDSRPPALARASSAPRVSLTGIVRQVRCSVPAVLDFILDTGGRPVSLHSDNYYTVVFTALGFTPTGALKPCSDLQGRQAKVDYIPTSDASTGRILSVELHK